MKFSCGCHLRPSPPGPLLCPAHADAQRRLLQVRIDMIEELRRRPKRSSWLKALP